VSSAVKSVVNVACVVGDGNPVFGTGSHRILGKKIPNDDLGCDVTNSDLYSACNEVEFGTGQFYWLIRHFDSLASSVTIRRDAGSQHRPRSNTHARVRENVLHERLVVRLPRAVQGESQRCPQPLKALLMLPALLEMVISFSAPDPTAVWRS
jgi:hypothetical protein